MFKPFSASRSAPQLRNAFLCALLLLPFLAIFAPRASAQSNTSLPRVEVAAGPAVTEGEPATFHVRVRPVQTEALEVPITVWNFGKSVLAKTRIDMTVTIPANTSQVTASVPTIDDDVDENNTYIDVTPRSTSKFRLGAGKYYDDPFSAYTRVLVKDNDPGNRPILGIHSQEPKIPNFANHTWVSEGDTADFTIKADEVATVSFEVCVGVTDSHGRKGDFLAPQNEGRQCVNFPAGQSSVTFSVPTVDDDVAEETDDIVIQLLGGAGYFTKERLRYVRVFDNDGGAVPVVNIPEFAGATEGGSATFTLTAWPRPTSDLTVRVRVTSRGNYGVATGYRNVTIPPSGTATLSVGTTDDSVDEPNGRVAVFLQAGDGYTVGSLAALSADILDDDEPEPQTQQTERQTQASTFVADATLVADIRQWRGETEHGQAHVDRWTRVLIALGVETGALAPMTASEAQGYADKGWTRWERAVAELQRKAAHDAGQTVPTPPPPTPEITISGGAGVTEGGDAEFTLTAAPTPTSEIDVTVTVTETGSFAASGATGTRTVPVGTGGTASFTVATENDATDEADGSIEAAVGSGSGYTVGSAATASVAVSDNDDPPMPEVNITASAGGTEGEAATFTLTATPAPASELIVGVTVAATGDYGVVTGDRNATIPTGGSVSLAVDTTDDSADEPNGTVTLTLNAGSGYTVGALSTGTADILDDDAPPQPQTQASTFVPDAQLVSDIRQWRGETQHGQTHIDRWTRVLIALGVETGALAPMTVSEAQGYADKGWTRWVAVLAELKRKEAHDAQPVTPVTPPPTLPTVTVSGDGAVTEGAGAVFTVSRTGDTAAALTVLLAVSEDTSGGRDFVDANDEGDKQVTIGAGSAAAAFTVPTTGDSTDEPDGAVTLALRTSSAYASGSPSSATVAVSDDDDTTGLPRVSIDDAEAQEGQGMVFTVRLSAPATKHAFVYVKTQESSPASATAGVDYQANHFSDPKRVVIIYRGSRERQFSVQTYRDAHDDDGETFEVVVTQAWMNASGGARPLPIADGVSVGTITNDGPLPGAYLARFGRAVAEQALDGIAGRLEADRAPGLRGTFAGLALGFGPGFGPASGQPAIGGGPALGMAGPGTPGAWLMPNIAPGFGAQALDPAAGASSASGTFGDRLGAGVPGAPPPRSRAMAAQEALLGSSFTLTRKRDGADGTMAFWGRTSRSRFDGAERGQGNDVALDGTVTTGMLGVDYARGGWLVGLALTRTLSDGRYASVGGGDPCAAFGEEAPAGCGGAQRIGDGDVEASLTAAVPYAAWRASERLKVWGVAGYGAGEVALKTFGGRHGADTSWSMAAAGVRGDLLAPRPGGGPALALVSDALWTRTASDGAPGLAASASDVTRLRLGLEGGWRLALPGGGSLMPKLELGARHDGGDAETGFGVELGGGFNWTEPRLGLALDVSGRALLTHEDGDLRDRGFSAALSFDPAPSTGLGPSLSLSQSLGGLARGGLDALFAPGPLERRTGSDANGRWAMEAAYGFPAFGDRFIGSPHVGFGQAAGSRDYSLGWRLAPEAENAPDLSFSLGAMRRESGAAEPEHGIKADIRLRW